MEDISGRDKLYEENPEEGRQSMGGGLKGSGTQFQHGGGLPTYHQTILEHQVGACNSTHL